MPAKTKKPPATIDSIRRQLADVEAEAGRLRAKLAKMEAHASGEEAPVCGLDLLWDAALPMSRQRSSKQKCRVAWAKLPAAARPTIAVAVAALKAWNRCKQWYIDDHLYAKGLDKFIKDRMWESLPEESKTAAPLHRNMSNPQPLPAPDADEKVVSPEEIARLLGRDPKSAAPAAKPKDNIHGPDQIAAMLGFVDAIEFPANPSHD
jgi:hypothetical protein